MSRLPCDGRLALELDDSLGQPRGDAARRGGGCRSAPARRRPCCVSTISWAMRVTMRRRPSASTISAFSLMRISSSLPRPRCGKRRLRPRQTLIPWRRAGASWSVASGAVDGATLLAGAGLGLGGGGPLGSLGAATTTFDRSQPRTNSARTSARRRRAVCTRRPGVSSALTMHAVEECRGSPPPSRAAPAGCPR